MGLLDIARCNPRHSERETHKVLAKKYGLALDIPQSRLSTKDDGCHIPLLRLRDWARFLLKHNCWHLCTGLVRPDQKRERSILKVFWARYKQWNPKHPIFQKAARGEVCLSRVAPICFHGDEGRSRKRSPFMVLSFYPMLGRGVCLQKKQKAQPLKRYLKLKPNFKGHSYTSRWLFTGLRKRDYTDKREHNWKLVLEEAATEAAHMCEVGAESLSGERHWMQLVHICGDWPFLHKSGYFRRSFLTVQKRLSQRRLAGICHLCLAGTSDVQFEQIATRRPKWLSTLHQESPFDEPNPFSVVLHVEDRLSELWAYDLFHVWHLGVSKNYLGSVLVILSELEPHSSVDARFDSLTEKYKTWCRVHKRRAHVIKINKELLNWTTTSQFPTGSWHKGELSTVLMEYVEWRFLSESFDDPMLTKAAEACHAIQACIRGMYSADLFLSPSESHQISELGFRFLRRYEQLAQEAHAQHKNLFVFQPKIHIIPHWLVALSKASKDNRYALNPLGTSCQQNEDFIGRASRVSRKVATSDLSLSRIMDRYLKAAFAKWVDCGYLVKPE